MGWGGRGRGGGCRGRGGAAGARSAGVGGRSMSTQSRGRGGAVAGGAGVGVCGWEQFAGVVMCRQGHVWGMPGRPPHICETPYTSNHHLVVRSCRVSVG